MRGRCYAYSKEGHYLFSAIDISQMAELTGMTLEEATWNIKQERAVVTKDYILSYECFTKIPKHLIVFKSMPKPESKKRKKIYQLDLQGHILNTFSSMAEAERMLGIAQSNISYVCNGRRKTAGGYKFIFAEEAII